MHCMAHLLTVVFGSWYRTRAILHLSVVLQMEGMEQRVTEAVAEALAKALQAKEGVPRQQQQ